MRWQSVLIRRRFLIFFNPFLFVLSIALQGQPATLTDATANQDQQFAPSFQAVEKWIGEKAFPGAVLAVGRHGRLLVLKSFGKMTYEADAAVMPRDAMFDLASCTKVTGCTTAAAILFDRRQLDLDAPVVKYLPE